jgi:hypothetical protein
MIFSSLESSVLLGIFLYTRGKGNKAEVEVEGLGKFKGVEGFVVIVLGLLMMGYVVGWL